MRGDHKLWADLNGVCVLARTLQAFQRCPAISRLAVVASRTHLESVQSLCSSYGLSRDVVCVGGSNRQESVLAGLRLLGACELVVVHDAARPLVTPHLIERGLEVAREFGYALCAVPAKSTFKLVDDSHRVVSTPPREHLWEAQTPQVFRYPELLAAHEQAAASDKLYTDDAALMEAAGYEVRVYEGSYSNIKITTPEDLPLVRVLHAMQGSED
ncbi:MAG: 2-C-methyl-D-erythritol 4-phosphate cytidylyltransferase [Chloroflexota bacterium]|nr:2-C-methyl-D-erythritol 4-phosphate cytidylyltransferase [Chloroflexota bacterium]